MSTHKIECPVSDMTVKAILDEVYTHKISKEHRPVISFQGQGGARCDLEIDWLGDVGNLQLNRQAIEIELRKILTGQGEVVVASRPLRFR